MRFQYKIKLLALLKVSIVAVTTVIALTHFRETNENIYLSAINGNALIIIDELFYFLFVVRKNERKSKVFTGLKSIFKGIRFPLYSVILLNGTSLYLPERFSEDLIICYLTLFLLDAVRFFYFEYKRRD